MVQKITPRRAAPEPVFEAVFVPDPERHNVLPALRDCYWHRREKLAGPSPQTAATAKEGNLMSDKRPHCRYAEARSAGGRFRPNEVHHAGKDAEPNVERGERCRVQDRGSRLASVDRKSTRPLRRRKAMVASTRSGQDRRQRRGGSTSTARFQSI